MKRSKIQKGITLIALIITIVVLLILAAVAIAAIQNENILSHANNAAVKYNSAVQNEQDTLGGYLNFLNNQGGSTEPEVDPAEIEFMERYTLGAEKTGKAVMIELLNIDRQTMTFTFKDDTETADVDESTLVTFLIQGVNENNTKQYLYAKYNNKAYRIVADITTYTTEDVEVCYIPQGREGDVIEGGTYDGWIILTDRDGLVEIVSPDVAKDDQGNALTLTLGSGDTSVTATTDLNDDDGTVDGKDIAILSYNNAITTINNYCKEVMNMENVRSVGGTNNTATPYSSTNYDDWSPVTIDVASGDMQFEEDIVKMSHFGIAATGTNYYWLASRNVYEDSSRVYFYVGSVRDGMCNGDSLWSVNSGGAVSPRSPAYGVRPVVINPSGI